jgi:hypothetical protein
MAHRKSTPPSADWATSLNLIDVVFANHHAVVEKWHETYNVALQRPWNQERWNHAYIELLSAMALVLGYKRLQQTDIDRYYSPEVFGNELLAQKELRDELLRVLKETKSLRAEPRRRNEQGGS